MAIANSGAQRLTLSLAGITGTGFSLSGLAVPGDFVSRSVLAVPPLSALSPRVLQLAAFLLPIMAHFGITTGGLITFRS